MQKASESGSKALFVWMVTGAFLLGAAFRLYGLASQTLVDDEWHSLSFVIGRSLPWVLTNFTVPNGFVSIPLNIHAWLLLKTVGWSEMLLRFPSVALGLTVLVVGPCLTKRLIGLRAAGTFALLLAISPALVFYTRLGRPYSVVACLGFVSILAAARWIRSGRLSDGITYAVCGLLAVYWHPVMVMVIGTMGFSAFLASVIGSGRTDKRSVDGLSWRQVVGVLLVMGAGGAVLMLPALLESFHSSMTDVARQGVIRFSSWQRVVSLFGGTANPVLIGVMWVCAIVGCTRVIKSDPWIGVTIALLFPVQILVFYLVRPHSCHVGIVLVRYSIALLPVFLMLAAHGFHAMLDALPGRQGSNAGVSAVIGTMLAIALVLGGPLPRTWGMTTGFTNHGVFQHQYGPIDWSHSFDSEFAPEGFPVDVTIGTEELSPFYGYLRQLGGERPIVEYPTMIGDHLNPHYFYQWYHQRPVLLGYAVGLTRQIPLPGGGVYGNTYVDDVLNLVGDPAKLGFRNHINMMAFVAMRERGVEFVVLHKRFEAEFYRLARPPASMVALLELYREQCYLVFEDDFVAVFSLDPVKPLESTGRSAEENAL